MQSGNKESVDGKHRIMKKILVIRLSSLGDVVLTAPVLFALRKQLGVEVHLLTKPKMGDLLHGGAAVDKFYTWGETGLMSKLKAEKYDGVLDLHCNFRSYWVRFLLLFNFLFNYVSNLSRGAVAPRGQGYNKKRFTRWLYVESKLPQFKVSHVQERYLDAANQLMDRLGCGGIEIRDWSVGLPLYSGVSEDSQRVVPGDISTFGEADFPNSYGVAILGGTYETKKIPKTVWQDIFSQDNNNWYLIGGANEKGLALELVAEFGDRLIDGVGVFDLETSSRCIALSDFVIGGDTGFSHVAATYNKPLLVIWGSTDPGLGFAAGFNINNVLHLITSDLSCHPCSKLGFDTCPKGHFRCMKDYSAQEIKLLLQKLQANSLGGR